MQISGAMVWSYHWPSFPRSHPVQGTAEIRRPTTLRLGTPRASSYGCSAPPLLSPSSLHLPWAGYTQTHRNTANTSTCVYTHMLGIGTQMQTGNTGISGAEDAHVQQCWRWCQSAPCPAFGAPCPPLPKFIRFSQGSLKPLRAQHVWWWW